jgi:hypothetical protein
MIVAGVVVIAVIIKVEQMKLLYSNASINDDKNIHSKQVLNTISRL